MTEIFEEMHRLVDKLSDDYGKLKNKLDEKPKESGWCNEVYKGHWYINSEYIKKASVFTTEEKAKEINAKQTLWRKMQKWADENNGEFGAPRFFLQVIDGIVAIDASFGVVVPMTVYFSSERLAERAREIFRDELLEVWGDK